MTRGSDVGSHEVSTLGEILGETGGVLQTGPFGSQLHASDYMMVGTPLVMPINIGDNEIREAGIARIGSDDARRLNRHALRVGDIVFSRRGDVGRRSLVRAGQSGWLCGTGCLAARFGARTDHVNSAYVAHYLGSAPAQTWLQDNAVGGTMPNLNTGILSALPIRLPPRSRQDRTVAALDEAGSEVVTLKRLIAKKVAIKQGTMQQLLTAAVRLPGFSKPWSYTRLRDQATMGGGGTPPSGTPRYYGGGVPWVSISDMTSASKYVRVTEKTLSDDGLSRSAAKLYDAGVVLYAMYASLGECALPVGRMSSSQAILGILPGKELDREYLYYYLCYRKREVREMGQQGTQSNLNAGMVRNFALWLPEPDEQRAIAGTLADLDGELDVLDARLRKAEAIKQGMMQQLLTDRARVPVAEAVT